MIARHRRLFSALALVGAMALDPGCSAGAGCSCRGQSAIEGQAGQSDDRVKPQSVEEAEAQRAAGVQWSEREIRAYYLERVSTIGAQNEQWIKDGLSTEERARKAYGYRHDSRMITRAMMSDRDAVARLQARDQEKYGSPDGPTFEWLVAKQEGKGLTGDAVYEAIIESSQQTNKGVNRRFGL